MKRKTSDSSTVARTDGTRSRDAGVLGARGAVRLTVLMVLLSGHLYASERIREWVQQIETANALVDRGDLNQAQTVYTKALKVAQTDGDQVRMGVVLQNVGRLLDRKGQLREAEKTYLRAVSAFNRSGAADERLVVRAYVGLAAVYIQTGQYSRAETLIRRVLADRPSGADADRASLMGSLGVILAHKQKFAEAEKVLRQTSEFDAGGSTEMHEVRAVAMANLAGIQSRGGRTAEAVTSYRQALSIMEALPDPSPATLSVALADYAGVLHELGDTDAAGAIYRRAIDIAQSRLGPIHPILGGLLQKYSELQRRSGNKAEARATANDARRIADESRRENLTGHTIPIEALMVSK